MIKNICITCRTQHSKCCFFVNLKATFAQGGCAMFKKKTLAHNVLQYINTPLVVSKKFTNRLIFTVAIRAYGVCLSPTEHLRTAHSTAGVALVNSCSLCPFKLDLNSAASPRWSQLNDLVPLMNRSTSLEVRALMRGP